MKPNLDETTVWIDIISIGGKQIKFPRRFQAGSKEMERKFHWSEETCAKGKIKLGKGSVISSA